ncbi:MAG: cytidine deaminase, partial [Flavobacteriales bacterium]|nr:cytidine deaminase [Flavobacteriales bacterium]
MAEFSITIKGTSVLKKELSQSDTELLLKAEQAASNAYAPYSQFNVGAALNLDNGQTVIGNNQENVAYPSGLCAERVAIFAASSRHPGVSISTMA